MYSRTSKVGRFMASTPGKTIIAMLTIIVMIIFIGAIIRWVKRKKLVRFSWNAGAPQVYQAQGYPSDMINIPRPSTHLYSA